MTSKFDLDPVVGPDGPSPSVTDIHRAAIAACCNASLSYADLEARDPYHARLRAVMFAGSNDSFTFEELTLEEVLSK